MSSTTNEMTTLSTVLEKLRLKKRDSEFRILPGGFGIGNGKFYTPQDLKIIKTYRFEGTSDPADSSIIYVIEANESGQKILLQNFVVYPTGSSAKVDYYINEGSWRKSRSFDIQNFVLNENLKNFLTKKGFNEDDVIISKFDNGEIKASEYFLYGTLSTSSGVKTILDNHEK